MMSFTPLHSKFHLVMRVVRAGIKYIHVACFVVGANVAVPEVAMDEGRLDEAPVGLKGPKELRDHVRDN